MKSNKVPKPSAATPPTPDPPRPQTILKLDYMRTHLTPDTMPSKNKVLRTHRVPKVDTEEVPRFTFRCDEVKVDGSPCLSRFETLQGLQKHKWATHPQGKKNKLKRNLDLAKHNLTNSSMTSFVGYGRLLNMCDQTLPELNQDEFTKSNPTMQLLCKLNANINLVKDNVQDYNACDVVLIPPELKMKKKSKNIKKFVIRNWDNALFRMAVFHDSSTTPGPCAYHTKKGLLHHSEVTKLALKNWRVFHNNKTFNQGMSTEANKVAALYHQLKGKYATAISRMIPKTPQRSKIIRLNKSIDSKGIFKKFEDEDLIESARIAYYEGIPEFIMKSNSSDWVEYPLKKFIEENDDNTIIDTEDPKESNMEIDLEFVPYEHETLMDVSYRLKKKMFETLSEEKREQIIAFANTKIHNFGKFDYNTVMRTELFIATCFKVKGPSSVSEIVVWLQDNIRPKTNVGWDSGNLINNRLGEYRHFAPVSGTRQTFLWYFTRDGFEPVKNLLKEWLDEYRDYIQSRIICEDNAECILSTEDFPYIVPQQVVTAERILDRKRTALKRSRNVNGTKDEPEIKKILLNEDRNSKLTEKAPATRSKASNYISGNILPIPLVVAEAINLMGELTMIEILDFLKCNFVFMRDWTAGNTVQIYVKMKQSGYFNGGETGRSQSTFKITDDSVQDKIKEWKEEFEDEIKKQLLKKSCTKLMFPESEMTEDIH